MELVNYYYYYAKIKYLFSQRDTTIENMGIGEESARENLLISTVINDNGMFPLGDGHNASLLEVIKNMNKEMTDLKNGIDDVFIVSNGIIVCCKY